MQRSLPIVLATLLVFILASAVSAQWIPDGNPVSTAADDQIGARVIGDARGGVVVAWIDRSNGSNWDLYAQRYDGFGQRLWSPGGVPVCTATGDQTKPALAADDSGGVYIAWEDTRAGNVDIYAQHLDAGGTPLWGAQGRIVCDAAGNQGGSGVEGPRIVRSDTKDVDAGGGPGVIICWHDLRNAGTTKTDIYAQRMDENGADWATNGIAVVSAAESQSYPVMASDGSEGAIIVWRDSSPGVAQEDIYAQRVNSSGTVLWAASGQPVCTAVEDQQKPRVIADGTGGAYVSWVDRRNGLLSPYALYVQRVDGSGNPLWAVNGVNIYGFVEYDEAELAPGPNGGVIVCWRDSRNGPLDIFAQRLTAGGVKQWGALGTAVTTRAGNDNNHRVSTDGEGGLYTVWDNGGFPVLDAYIQHLDSTGAASFSLDGRLVTNAPDRQNIPDVCIDGSQPAFVAWSDFRDSTDPDVYLTRIYHTVSDADDDAPPLGALQVRAYPNPFSGATEIAVAGIAEGTVEIAVYDVAGRRVATRRVAARPDGAIASFDGRDDAGNALASGVYLIRARAGGETATAKLLLMR